MRGHWRKQSSCVAVRGMETWEFGDGDERLGVVSISTSFADTEAAGEGVAI